MQKFILITFFSLNTIFTFCQTFPTNDEVLNREKIKTRTCALHDFDKDGDIDFIAIEESSSLLPNSKTQLVWFENEPTRQFKKRVLIDKDIVRPRHLIVVDFDKDGNQDYLVCMSSSAGANNNGELAWFQRQNNGEFIKWTIAASSDFYMADTADFNNDGLLDIVAVGFNSNSVSIFINDGLFFSEKIIKTNIKQVDLVKAGDLDNDGDIDIVYSDGNVNFNLIFNDGIGNFVNDTNLQKPFNRYGSEGLEIVDINNDGINDIITYDSYGFSDLVWLDGSNNWEENIILNASIFKSSGGVIKIVDLNKDGLLDIVTQMWTKNVVLALYQNTNHQFNYKIIDRYWDGSDNGQMAIGDIDNDNDMDILFAENGNVDFDFSWFENIQGELFRHTISGQYYKATICKTTDINNDSNQDIILSCGGDINNQENELILLQNLGNGKFQDWVLHDNLVNVKDVELSDLDNDGDFDIVATVYDQSDLVVLINEGNYAFWKTDTIDMNINNVEGIALADLDNNMTTDIIACANGDAKVFWYKNNGSNSYSKRIVDADLKKPKDAEIADFDGDGDLDIAVVAEDTSGYLTVYLNNGSGVFTKSQQIKGRNGLDVEIGDPNNDGKPDIFVTSYPINGVRGIIEYAENKGNGTFEIKTIITAVNNQKILSLKYADVNGDTEPDLLFGYNDPGYSHRTLDAIIYKQGKIEEVVRLTRFDRGSVTGIDVGDFNNDNVIDIVQADYRLGDLRLSNYPCYIVPQINIGNDTIISANSSIILSQPFINGYTYIWSTGETTRSITIRQPGNYSLTVTNDYGCPASDSITITSASNVKDIEELDITISPNPTKGLIMISSKEKPINNGVLELYNTSGQKVKINQIVSNHQIQIDMTQLNTGIYILSFIGKEFHFTSKIFKE